MSQKAEQLREALAPRTTDCPEAQEVAAAIVSELGITREMSESVAMMARYNADPKDGARIFAAADALTVLLDLAEGER